MFKCGHLNPSFKGMKRSPEVLARIRAGMAKRVKPLAERFEAKVDRSGGPEACHQWTNAIRAHGYGHIFLRVENGKTITELAHRVAWMLAGNELPVWPKVIDHTCKNMGCVNVKHLRVVTQAINSTENSNSPHGINSRKTHCVRGHAFTPENTYVGKNGGRNCRACRPLRPCMQRKPR